MELDLDDPMMTDHFGECLAKFYLKKLKSNNTYVPLWLLLDGEIGAGKSCIGRAMIKYLTHEDTVPSPSYLISLSYTGSIDLNGKHEIKIHHIDPYRLKSTQKLEQLLDIKQMMNDVMILEHSQKTEIPSILDQKYVIRVRIQGKKISTPSEFGFDQISTRGLSTMGRSIDISVSDDSVFDLSVLKDLFHTSQDTDADIKTKVLRDSNIDTDTLLESKVTTQDVVSSSPVSHTHHHKQLIQSLQQKLKESPEQVLIMGVETSCDDTCISIIDALGTILVNYQIGQNEIHKPYGGVHPMYAKQAHQDNLDIYMDKALQDIYAKYSRYPDAISFTMGPGLEVCLITGVNKVYETSKRLNIPIIPTHHMESHIMVCRLPGLKLDVEYPFVCCVVSGGHTFIAYVEAEGMYKLLSTTNDDSMGETIDKVGRELGLTDIPAGRDFEQLAITGDVKRFTFPRPCVKNKPYDVSFSGLKFAGIDSIRKNIEMPDDGDWSTASSELKQKRSDFAASFQEHIMEYLVSQFKKVYQKLLSDKKINCIVLAGGVASNTTLRSKMDKLGKDIQIPIKYPPPSLCTDNGIMVAWNGCEKLKNGFLLEPEQDYDPKIRSEVRARWKLW